MSTRSNSCFGTIIAAAACVAAGCSRVDSAPSLPGANDENTIAIMATTQGRYGDLFIGVGNVGPGEFVDEAGAKKKGLTATLFISHATPPANETKVRVHAGQKVTVAPYTFLVQEIRKSGRGSVRLQFEGGPPPKAPGK